MNKKNLKNIPRKTRRSDKCDYVYGQVRSRILSGEYTGILPGSQILAEHYGVSLMTASKAVSLLAKEGLVERLPRKGTVIRPRPSSSMNKIAIIVRDISFPLTSRMVAEFGRMTRDRDIQPLFMQHFDDPIRETNIARELAAHRLADGAVMVPCSTNEHGTAARILQKSGIPVVVLPINMVPFDDINTISFDESDAFEKGTAHLIAEGHSEIAVVFPRRVENNRSAPAYEKSPRWQGYAKAMQAAQVTPHPPIWFDATNALQHKKVSLFIRRIKPYSALFLHHDSFAATVLMTLHREGVHVPGDISLISYDGAPLAEALDLSTLSVPMEQAGLRAIEILHEFKADPLHKIVHESLPAKLIIRGSIAPH